MIYLDYTANTPADPDVLDAYLAAERRYIANPNSTHIAGQEARAEMERVTQSIAQHLGVQPAEIIYTSGASEANNLAAMEWIRWLDVPLLCLLALLVLPLLHLTRSAVLSDRVFRHPWLGAAVTFVLMWAMIFLPSYTMGGIGAGRLLNVVWMTFVLGLAATEFLLLGWLERVRGVSLHGAEQFCRRQARRLPLLAAAMLLCMACIGSHTVKEGQDSYFATSLEAAYELANGSARRYADALDAREALLNDAAQPDVSIRPLNDDERPWLLFYTDVAPGPDMWGLTPYFGKQSVTISDFE